MEEEKIDLSIIVPAYNEETGLDSVLKKLVPVAREHNWPTIVVDDGSDDGTADVARKYEYCTLIQQPYNKGYGAAIKTGVRQVNTEFIMMIDSDGQHNPDDIPKLLNEADKYDMIIGERQKDSQFQLKRRPGKKILSMTANFLSGVNIPDLNCGFRLIRLSAFKEFLHIYPNGFSISTTSTIAFLQGAYSVKWVPITTLERVGRKSNVSMVKDGLATIMLIVRAVTLFNPLKVFLPASFFVFMFGLLWASYGVMVFGRFPNIAIVIMIFGFLLFFFGILADLISMIRRKSPDE